jgi:hypothetical protein
MVKLEATMRTKRELESFSKATGLQIDPQGNAVWEQLWGVNYNQLPGKDVTAEVTSALRLVKERPGERTTFGYLVLPQNLNEAFGDPSFGSTKVPLSPCPTSQPCTCTGF